MSGWRFGGVGTGRLTSPLTSLRRGDPFFSPQVPAGLWSTGTSTFRWAAVAQHSNAAFRAISLEVPAAASSREACASTQGPGIQAFGVMPPEGVDADCVWIDPALGMTLFWFECLDSNHTTPECQASYSRGVKAWYGSNVPKAIPARAGFRGPSPGMTIRAGFRDPSPGMTLGLDPGAPTPE